MIQIVLILNLLLIASVLDGIRSEFVKYNAKSHEEEGSVYTTDSL